MNLKSETPDPSNLNPSEIREIKNAIDSANQNLKVFDAKAVRESDLYRIAQTVIECPDLVGNPMFDKIKARLESFYIMNEKYKQMGPTPAQQRHARDTGYTFEYQVVLHAGLKRLLIKVFNQKDKVLRQVYLKEVYSWLT